MKKALAVFATALLCIAVFAACSPPVSELEGTQSPTTQQPTWTVEFTDPTLEAMVRAAMCKPDGDITLADAEDVTVLSLSYEWQRLLPDAVPIREINGLEYFKNLESLDLSFHEITDVAPLAGLSKLSVLSLRGNPVADITPLAGLTNLTVLALDRCEVDDFAPLAALTGIRHLYLAECPSSDYAPLEGIYANLEGRDFEILPPPTSLVELGFTFNDGEKLALYGTEEYDIRLNHGEWGDPPQPDWRDCIRVVTGSESGYKNAIGFYPVHNAYVVWMFDPNTQGFYTYIYDVAENSFGCERADMEPIVREAFGDADGEDVLLTPVAFFDNTIEAALGMSIEELYALPFEPLTLDSIGFTVDESIVSYLYEQHEPYYFTVQIHDPEWGSWEGGGDVRFFLPLSDEYRVIVTYHIDEQRFSVGADDNDGGGAAYDYFIGSDEHTDIWCSDESMTVEEYFRRAINDPAVTHPSDIYQFSIKQMVRTVEDTFGMSIDELYALSIE